MNGPPLVAEAGSMASSSDAGRLPHSALPKQPPGNRLPPGSRPGRGENARNPNPNPNPKPAPKPKPGKQQATELLKKVVVRVAEADGLSVMLQKNGVCLRLQYRVITLVCVYNFPFMSSVVFCLQG